MMARDPGLVVLDARTGRLAGATPEPRSGLLKDQMPGSQSLPSTSLLAPDGTMLPPKQLRTLFTAAEADGTKPVVTSCGTGVTATIVSLGLLRAGLTQRAAYDGSWTEWASRPDTVRETTLMPDDHAFPTAANVAGLATRLSHAGRAGTKVRAFVNPPLHRGSTMLHLDVADRIDGGKHPLERGKVYGAQGNATHHALEDVVAEIEGGTRCQIFSTGHAAVSVSLLCYLKPGEHCLMPDSVYGPARIFANGMLSQFGVTTEFYAPTIAPAALEALFRPNTTVLYLESPGSHTFEVQDVPALAAVARAKGAKVLMDNTWGIHHFQPFRHGVDVSIQALTKYVVGHSDVLLGSITVATPAEWERVRLGSLQLGQYASPDDCWLALRGVRTMAVRLKQQMRSGLTVAEWFAGRPEVHQVLHPALPGAPGHELWKRDFTGACSLFGVVFKPELTPEATHRMLDALELFGIGASWGGFESLAWPTTGFQTRMAGSGLFAGPICRFHVGLEDPADLIADLERAFVALKSS